MRLCAEFHLRLILIPYFNISGTKKSAVSDVERCLDEARELVSKHLANVLIYRFEVLKISPIQTPNFLKDCVSYIALTLPERTNFNKVVILLVLV